MFTIARLSETRPRSTQANTLADVSTSAAVIEEEEEAA